jgi:hypothetical protein
MAARAILGPLMTLGLALGMLSVPGVAEARPNGPTLTLAEYCPVIDGVQFYGVGVSLSGFPPNAPFEGTLEFDDGSAGPAAFTTDEFGNFGPFEFASSEPVALYTATIVYSGGTLHESSENVCQGPPQPTAKAQCKRGGFVGRKKASAVRRSRRPSAAGAVR